MIWRLQLPYDSYHSAVAVGWRHGHHDVVVGILAPNCEAKLVEWLFGANFVETGQSILDIVSPCHFSLTFN